MEVEFKFHIPEDRLDALSAAVASGQTNEVRLEARYFDTQDGALSAHGMALRLRKEGDRWVQTLKAKGAGPLDRLEDNVDVEGSSPQIQPSLHAQSKAGKQLRLVLGKAQGELQEIYRTEITRTVRDLLFEGGSAELALDIGRIVAHAGTEHEKGTPVRELELELKEGPVSGLVELAKHWASAHGLLVSTVSKSQRGERLKTERWTRPAVKAVPMATDDKLSIFLDGVHLQRVVVANCLAQILGNASEIVERSDDGTHVHQLRVGIRRLRTALRELSELFPGSFNPAWEQPLVDVFRALGELRDREQAVETIGADLPKAEAPRIHAQPHEAASTPIEIIQLPGFQAALIELMGFTAPLQERESDPPRTAMTAKESRKFLHQRLRKLHKKISQAAEHFQDLSVDEQHSVRKRLKRLRFLTEFVAPVFSGEAVEEFLDSLQPALSALGRLNDEHVASGVYRDMAEQDPKAWFAVGWLSAKREATVKTAEKALRRMKVVPRMLRV